MREKAASILGLLLLALIFVGGIAVLVNFDHQETDAGEPLAPIEADGSEVLDLLDGEDWTSTATTGTAETCACSDDRDLRGFVKSDPWDTVRMGMAKGLPGVYAEAVNILKEGDRGFVLTYKQTVDSETLKRIQMVNGVENAHPSSVTGRSYEIRGRLGMEFTVDEIAENLRTHRLLRDE